VQRAPLLRLRVPCMHSRKVKKVERRTLWRACRRVSNRESARRSRARRFQEVERLQAQLRTLKETGDVRQTELRQAHAHQAQLSERLHKLQQKQEMFAQQVRRRRRCHAAWPSLAGHGIHASSQRIPLYSSCNILTRVVVVEYVSACGFG
jgi:chromosome segregation ATPase